MRPAGGERGKRKVVSDGEVLFTETSRQRDRYRFIHAGERSGHGDHKVVAIRAALASIVRSARLSSANSPPRPLDARAEQRAATVPPSAQQAHPRAETKRAAPRPRCHQPPSHAHPRRQPPAARVEPRWPRPRPAHRRVQSRPSPVPRTLFLRPPPAPLAGAGF
ncbi:hypothetical protein CDD83_8294 [Cordyceps sp. RAO-2017]|nr:hypothetical protein CDD83_8294 [Cordyceps sp. RAO-2017]